MTRIFAKGDVIDVFCGFHNSFVYFPEIIYMKLMSMKDVKKDAEQLISKHFQQSRFLRDRHMWWPGEMGTQRCDILLLGVEFEVGLCPFQMA